MEVTMHPRALVRSAVFVFLLLSGCAAMPQDTSSPEDVRSMLRVVSQLLPDVDKTQLSSVAFNVAGQQMRIGDLAGALASAQAAGSENDRTWVTSNIASIMAAQGNLASALKLVQTSSSKDAQAKAQAYASVARELAEKNAFQGALNVTRVIRDSAEFVGKANLLVDTLMRIQTKQWEARDRAGADNTLNLALDAVQQEEMNSSVPALARSQTAQMYGGIANDLADEGNRAAALSVIEIVQNRVAEAPDPAKHDLLLTLAVAQAHLGDFQAARASAGQMEPGKRDTAIDVIGMQRTKQGQPLDALDEAVTLSSEFSRNSSFRGIADALAASGNYPQALSTVGLIEGAGEQAYGLSELAYEQAERNDPAAAQTVQLAWEAAMNAGETKPYVFGQIAMARGLLGDFPGAQQIVGRLPEQERAWTLQNLTSAMVSAGKITEAVALAESQDSALPKACAILGITGELIAEQKDKAKRSQGARL
jgi:hypothetical protein